MTVSFFCYSILQLTTDSDDNPYPKRFLLLGMLLFKDILPILAVDHPNSECSTQTFADNSLHS